MSDLWAEFVASGWGREFMAGAVGGTAGVLAGYPLDTLRVRQQHSSEGSALALLRRIVAKEGPFSLYRGMLAPLASISIQNALVFQSYATLSRALNNNPSPHGPPSYTAVALSGTGAGVVQSFLISPIELLKIQLQLRSSTAGPMEVARSIYKTQGWRGIYRGLGVTILRDAPSHGVYFLTYEYVKEGLRRRSGEESLRTMVVAGGLAGVTSWICIYPLDVIKTRMQVTTSYGGIVDCLARSVGGEGYGVLWRGLGATVARAFVVNGLVFTAYEMALTCINNKD